MIKTPRGTKCEQAKISPYGSKEQFARESRLSFSEKDESKSQSRLANLSQIFKSQKLSQMFKKPAFYSSVRNGSRIVNRVTACESQENANPFMDESSVIIGREYTQKTEPFHQRKNSSTSRKRESMDDFRAKLNRLEKNKEDLEAKMKEFETKIRASSNRLKS